MQLTLVTQRLELRPIALSEADELHALWTHPKVREFLFDGEAIPLAQTLEIVAKSAALFAAQRYGLWGVRRTPMPELIGFSGFWHFHEPPQLELLYGMAHPNGARATRPKRHAP